MPKFSFNKLSKDDQDLLLKGHGNYVAACGHALAQCSCHDKIKVPLMIRCSKCDPGITLEDHYAAVNDIKATFGKKRERIMRSSLICDRLKKCASELIAADEEKKEVLQGRVTTKNDKPLATLIRTMKPTDNIVDFMKKVNEMAKPDDGDSSQDRLVKQVYRAFLDDLKKSDIDTSKEIQATNKDADVLIAEITKGIRPVEQLIKLIEKFKAKH